MNKTGDYCVYRPRVWDLLTSSGQDMRIKLKFNWEWGGVALAFTEEDLPQYLCKYLDARSMQT